MENTAYRAIAIVGVGAILPDAPNVAAFWQNVKTGRYSITDVNQTAGTRRSTTIRTRKRPTRPTRKSADGCASGSGTP